MQLAKPASCCLIQVIDSVHCNFGGFFCICNVMDLPCIMIVQKQQNTLIKTRLVQDQDYELICLFCILWSKIFSGLAGNSQEILTLVNGQADTSMVQLVNKRMGGCE